MQQHLWLIEFEDLDAVSLPAAARRWQALGAHPHRAYAASAAPPGNGWQRLECLQALPGASAGETAVHHYAVEADVAPEHEAEFHAWYVQEHLPGLAAVPGTIDAARYRREASPRFLACYHLTAPEVLGSAPWLAVRHTAWSSVVRPLFRHTRRLMFRAV